VNNSFLISLQYPIQAVYQGQFLVNMSQHYLYNTLYVSAIQNVDRIYNISAGQFELMLTNVSGIA